jgi:hypothetical protein
MNDEIRKELGQLKQKIQCANGTAVDSRPPPPREFWCEVCAMIIFGPAEGHERYINHPRVQRVADRTLADWNKPLPTLDELFNASASHPAPSREDYERLRREADAEMGLPTEQASPPENISTDSEISTAANAAKE